MADFNMTQAVTVAALTLAASIGGSWFSSWLALRKERRLKAEDLSRSGNYLAIRVVCILDQFVDRCCDIAGDTGIPDSDGTMGAQHSTPKIEYPADLDWRSSDPDLMYRALAMPNEISAADESISFIGSEIAGPPDYSEYFDERIIRYGEIGLRAMQLAAGYRARYGIPARKLNEQYDPQRWLSDKAEAARKQVQRREESSAALMQSLQVKGAQ